MFRKTKIFLIFLCYLAREILVQLCHRITHITLFISAKLGLTMSSIFLGSLCTKIKLNQLSLFAFASLFHYLSFPVNNEFSPNGTCYEGKNTRKDN